MFFVITNIFQVSFNIFSKFFLTPCLGQIEEKWEKCDILDLKLIITKPKSMIWSFIDYFLMYWCEIHISSKIWLIKNIFQTFMTSSWRQNDVFGKFWHIWANFGRFGVSFKQIISKFCVHGNRAHLTISNENMISRSFLEQNISHTKVR